MNPFNNPAFYYPAVYGQPTSQPQAGPSVPANGGNPAWGAAPGYAVCPPATPGGPASPAPSSWGNAAYAPPSAQGSGPWAAPAAYLPYVPVRPMPQAAPSFALRQKDPRKTGGRRAVNRMSLLILASCGLSTLLQMAIMQICLALDIWTVLEDDLSLSILAIMLSPLCTAGPFLVYMLASKGDWNQALRFEKAGFLTSLLYVFAGLGLCIAGNYPAFLLEDLLESAGASPLNSSLGSGDSWLSLVIELLGVAVLVPLIEEFAFRGVLFSSLQRFGAGFALAGSSILFGMAHLSLSSVIFASIAGLGMGVAYAKTKNLWVSIAIHAANNGIATLGGYGELLVGANQAELFQELLSIVPLGLGLAAFLLLLIMGHRRKRRQTALPGSTPAPEPAAASTSLPPLRRGESAVCIFTAPAFWGLVFLVLLETGARFLLIF